MEPVGSSDDQILVEFLSMGFNQAIVRQALSFTSDREKAMELILEATRDAENFQQPIQSQPNNNKPNSNDKNNNNKMQSEHSSDFEDHEEGEDYKMVFVVRTDLGMKLGKMAAQVGHATIGAYKRMDALAQTDPECERTLAEWMELGQKKIVVKTDSEAELLALADKAAQQKICHYVVRDAGRTQIAAGSITVAGFGPAPSDVLDRLTRHLKLL